MTKRRRATSPAPGGSRFLHGTAPHGRRRSRRGWLACLLAIFLLLPGAASAADDPWAPFDAPWFERLGMKDGLPHSIATAMAQDARGLVWIGTMGGLVRYDGYRMQVFSVPPGHDGGLPDAYVRCLLALPDGSLLIGTDAGGLSRFDPATNTFRNYPVGQGGTSDGKIYALALAGGDGVWIATERGLDRLDLASDRIAPVDTGSEASPRDFSVLQDKEGNLWLGNSRGLFVRPAVAKAFVRPPRPAGDIDTVLDDGIWALFQDREGRLWVGSGQAGAAYRDAAGRWQPVPGFSGFQPDGERRSTVRDFLEIASGRLWIGTDGSGVLTYAPGAAQTRQIAHDASVGFSLPGNSVRALMEDRSGNAWVATDLGVAHHNPNARTAFALQPSAQGSHTLANANVRGVYVDSRKRIWLGMNAGHVDVIDLDQGVIHHLQLGGSQAQRDVQSFAETPDGAIWVGTQGLARVDPLTLAIRDSAVPALDAMPVLHLLADGHDLLIATYDGVYRYDTLDHALSHFRHDAGAPDSLASDTVRSIARVDDALWYITGNGISIARDASQDGGFENLQHRPGDPQSLPSNWVSSIADDPRGGLWVGTRNGLAMLESGGGQGPRRFRAIGYSEGLSSDNISAVLVDDRGNPWLSLSNGVSMVDAASHAVRNLGIRDGLRISGYIFAAAARAPGGELLFGGLGGLTVVRPDWQPPAVAEPPLVVTRATVGNAVLPFGKLPRPGGRLRLGPRNRSLRADFALLDYQAPTETSYSYRLEGFDDDWIEVPHGSQPSAIYTNLPKGRYTLRLRARTSGLHPRLFETTLDVDAKPRWYETVTAAVLAALALAALIVALIQVRTLYLRRQARHMQRQIELRTRELLAANRRLDELANTDALTGLLNRRHFLERAETLRQRARGGGDCLALLDLDHFKQINDTYGHQAGDAVIQHVAAAIRRHCRDGDLVGRYGGEEMIAYLPNRSLEQAGEAIEQLRASLEKRPAVHEGLPIRATVSIGLAAFRSGDSLAKWLSRADRALYEAKRAGRNRCVATH